MPKKSPSTPARIYQLKITLNESDPEIWRRILVRGDTSLNQLHQIIQWTMGWQDCHLHEFHIGEARYGKPDQFDETVQAETRVNLERVAPQRGTVFRYWYDFGDDWWHTITVEKLLDPDPTHEHPKCIDGKNACPPEDCGGIWGYGGMLAAIANPEQEGHASYLEWLGEDFDPKKFDIEAANRALGRLKG